MVYKLSNYPLGGKMLTKAYRSKPCDKCGQLIAFHKNRNGKLYPVDVFHHPKMGEVYHSNYGNHSNMTKWHECRSTAKEDVGFDLPAPMSEQDKAIVEHFIKNGKWPDYE